MVESLGFLGRNYTRRDSTYTNPYATSRGNDRYQRRLFEQLANQPRQSPQRGMYPGCGSSLGGMGGLQHAQTVRGGLGGMGTYPATGYSPYFGMGGGDLDRLPLSYSPMGTQRYSSFGLGADPFARARDPFSYRPRRYPAWPSTCRNSSRFLDDDDSDDDDEYSVPSVYRFPSRRRIPRAGYRRPVFGRQPRNRYWNDFYYDDYDGFEDLYDDDDDDDYDDYFPVTGRHRGF